VRLALAVVAIAVLPYLNALSGGFTFDDYGLVIDNPVLPEGTPPLEVFVRESIPGGAYRPLTMLTYMANERVASEPRAFHVVDVALHALTALLALALGLRLLDRTAAIAAAVLFAVHPVHTEAVASIAGRPELLSAAFVLVTLLASLHAEDASAGRRPIWRALSLIAFGAGLLSKENALTAVPLLLLVHRWPPVATPVRRIAWVLVPYLIVTAAYLGARHHALGALTIRTLPPLLDNPLAHVDVGRRVATAIVVLWQYVSVLALPARLSADDSFDQIPVVASVLDPRFLTAAAMLALVAGAALVARRRAPGVAGGLAFAALAMAVTANVLFPIGTIKGERLLYLPSVGWCLACGWLVARWRPARPALRAGVLALLVLVLVGRTWIRNRDWHDELALFSATVTASPNSARAQNNAAAVYGQAGRLDEAIAHYRNALAIYPEFRTAALGIARAYELSGHGEEARYWRSRAASVPGTDEPDGHVLGR
jgi:hypothetical protein